MTISKIIGVFFFAFAATAVPKTSRAISGAVSGSAATLTLSGAATGSTTTDAKGNYVFSGLATGSYTVTPSQSGYTFTPPSASVTLHGTSITGVNFTGTAVPPTSYSISGSVSGSAATLTLSGPAAASTTTTSTGSFTFSGLANGAYKVTPSQSGHTFSPSSASITVNGASITGVNFTATAVTVSHNVTLTWTTRTSSNIVGYNVYRGSTSGGPYTQIGFTGGTSYVDASVSSGLTYFYVATAVDGSNHESADSNQATAVIPIP